MQAFRLASVRALKSLFGFRRTAALSADWRELARRPSIVSDLCMLGQIFEPDIDPETGRLYPSDELIARAARKSFALTILARAEITHAELNQIRQEGDDYDLYDDDDDQPAFSQTGMGG